MNRRTELSHLLLAGQQAEAEAPPVNTARALDRVWSAAAHEGLVSGPPPLGTYTQPLLPPPPQPPRRGLDWRQVAVIVMIVIGALVVSGSVILWQHANSGQQLINTEIPTDGGGGGE